MNRRSFLRAAILGTGAVVATQVEPIRTYFFAPAGGWRDETLWEKTARQYREGLMFRKDAFSLLNSEAFRFQREYNQQQSRFVARMDVLYGVRVLRPEYAVRIVSANEELTPAVISDEALRRLSKQLADKIDADAAKLYRKIGVIENVEWSEVEG